MTSNVYHIHANGQFGIDSNDRTKVDRQTVFNKLVCSRSFATDEIHLGVDGGFITLQCVFAPMT